MFTWIKDRLSERTSMDGTAIIAVALIVLFLSPFAKIIAYAGIAYGLWSIWKSE